MKNFRISFLTTGLGFGGAESQLVRLACGLKDRGYSIQVISMTAPKEYVAELNEQGISVMSLGMKPGIPDIRALFSLSKILKAFRPDILHSHMIHANVLARIVRLFNNFPIQISTAHNINEGGKVRQLMYRFTDCLCDLTTNVSLAAVNKYVELGIAPSKKIIYVPNGIDTETFIPDSSKRESTRRELGLGNNFVWLAVGRFDPAKDHETMIKAFSKVYEEYPSCLLLLVGEGGLKPKIQEMVKDLGLSEKVRFLGSRKDISSLMNGADGYLMSSAWEGLPMVLLEAGASGLPIVTTDVGGNSEIVEQGVTGFLVKPSDPSTLAITMVELMQLSPAQLKQMGEAGRARVLREYSFDSVLDIWEKIYSELFNKRNRVRE